MVFFLSFNWLSSTGLCWHSSALLFSCISFSINKYNSHVANFCQAIFVPVYISIRHLMSRCFVTPFYLFVVDSFPLDTDSFASFLLDSVYHCSRSGLRPFSPGFSIEPQHQISFFENINSWPTIVKMFIVGFVGGV